MNIKKIDKRLLKNGKVLCPRCLKGEAQIDRTLGVLPCKECNTKHQKMVKMPEFAYNQAKGDRVREQRQKYASDLEQPWALKDRKWKPNPKFIKYHKNNPEMLKSYFTNQELRRHE